MELTKKCIWCNLEFFNNVGESQNAFADRKFCSNQCYVEHRKAIYEKVYLPPKICEYCKNQFKQRENENDSKFKARRFCGLDCARSFSIIIANKTQNEKGRVAWNKGMAMDESFRKACSNAQKGRTRSERLTFPCETCGKDVVKTAGKAKFAKHHFCDKHCASLWRGKTQWAGKEPWNKGRIMTQEEKDKAVLNFGDYKSPKGEDSPNWGKHLSEEHKKAIGDGNRGKTIPQEQRDKMSLAKMGENNPQFGKPSWNKDLPMPEETKEKLREARLHQICPTKDTKPERFLQSILTTNGIKYDKHIPILGQPDVFIEPNILIFIDGDYTHANPAQYDAEDKIYNKSAKNIWAYDQGITESLTELGFIVIRFWQSQFTFQALSTILKAHNLNI